MKTSGIRKAGRRRAGIVAALGMAVISASAAVRAEGPIEFWVDGAAAPEGDGSAARPFATLEAAREAVAVHRRVPVRVWIRPGHYVMREGWTLGTMDVRIPEARVTYEATEPGTVRISSGVVVPREALRPVSDAAVKARLPESVRDAVRELPLEELGIRAARFPAKFRGLELIEVFQDGRRLPISRWPNDGIFAKIERVLDNGITGDGGTFVYRGDVPARWVGALEDGVWIRGFWRVPWTIEAVRVAAIDPAQRTITHAVAIPNGIGSKYHREPGNGTGPGSGEEPWEAINLIEEIDVPGEWAVRFSTGMLYILPPDGAGELLITDHAAPVVSFVGVENTDLVGLHVDGGMGDGVRVEGGRNVMLAGCRVTNVARDGIVLAGGSDHLVLSCDTAETGFSGINFLGGDRATLTPSGHRILNNLVTRAGVYYPAAGILGGIGPQAEAVGNRVAHNRIHDCANSGVVYGGNENVFEFNEIYRVGLGSSDLGCFYTTGGWTSRGNVVRHNFVHHAMNANAFYVDDGDSGDTFFGNVAYRTQSGGFIGGGHDQVFRNNVIVANPRAMHVDARGIARGYTVDDARLRTDLESVPFRDPPWSVKYPALTTILESEPERPSGIEITENLFVNCDTDLRRSGTPEELGGVVFERNVVSNDMGMFVDPAKLNFALKPDALVFQELPGFAQIPMERIGLYRDAYRRELPERDFELLRTGDTSAGFDSQTDVDASNRPGGP